MGSLPKHERQSPANPYLQVQLCLPAVLMQIPFRGGSRKFRKRGPSPPLPGMKTSLFRACSIQHCGRIRDVKWSNVNVLEESIQEHLIKRFPGRLEWVESYKNVLKKGGAPPPPLNPPMPFMWQSWFPVMHSSINKSGYNESLNVENRLWKGVMRHCSYIHALHSYMALSTLGFKVHMKWKIISANLKDLSKYKRMAFFFLKYHFRFRDINVFLLCKLDQWWRHIVCN